MSERVDNNFNETLKGDFLMMIGVIAASCFTVFSGKYLKKIWKYSSNDFCNIYRQFN